MSKYKLKELGSFKNGANYPKGSYGDGMPIVNVKDLFTPRFVDLTKLVQLKHGALKNEDDYTIQDDDILFSRSSLVQSGAGMCAIAHNIVTKTLFCGFIIRYRIERHDIVLPLYLLYLLRTPIYRKLFTGTQQTNITNINHETLGDIEVDLPDIRVQKEIVSVIKSIDDKNDNNAAICADLEAMAKQLYDYWFVQFDFPDENGKPYKSSGGKMVWNEDLKMLIPDGWYTKPLNDCVDTIIDHRGKTPAKMGGNWVAPGTGVMAFSAKLIKGNRLVNLDDANWVSEKMYKAWMREELQDGDILMTSEAPLGEFYYLKSFTKYCLSQRLFAIRADLNVVLPSYLFMYLSGDIGLHFITGKQSGSTVFGIRQDELRKVAVLIPIIEVQKAFCLLVDDVYKIVREKEQENQKLTSLRGFLLPMLMNGQVKVQAPESVG